MCVGGHQGAIMQNHNARYRGYCGCVSECDAGVAPTRKSRKIGITIHNLWHGAVLSGREGARRASQGRKIYEADAAVTSKKPQTPAPRNATLKYIYIYLRIARRYKLVYGLFAPVLQNTPRRKGHEKIISPKGGGKDRLSDFYLASACDAQIENRDLLFGDACALANERNLEKWSDSSAFRCISSSS